MADWLDSVELTKGRGVWVRRDVLVEELPDLDLDPDSEVSLSVPIDECTTDRTLYARNRDAVTRPPAEARQVRPPLHAVPAPLFDEAPDPSERTPPTFDMGLVPASYMEDEPTEAGADPQAVAEAQRASMDLADYDDDADLSTDCVSAVELARAIARARGANVAPAEEVATEEAPVDELAYGSYADDESLSLTLDLDPSWLVPQEDQQPPASRTPAPMARRSLAERAPAPPRSLADRAPAPHIRQPLRSTIPTHLRSQPSAGAMPGWVVNTTTFVCGMIVGGTCAGTISVLSFTAAILV